MANLQNHCAIFLYSRDMPRIEICGLLSDFVICLSSSLQNLLLLLYLRFLFTTFLVVADKFLVTLVVFTKFAACGGPSAYVI